MNPAAGTLGVSRIRVSRPMTVTGVIRASGAMASLAAPVRVEAGQQIRFGVRADGVPVVSITSDTPIFDGVGLSSVEADTVLGVCAAPDLPRPALPESASQVDSPQFDLNQLVPDQRRGLGLDSHDTDREWGLLHAADESVEPIFGGLLRGLRANSERQQMMWV
jgi:hypothetical protein